MDGNRIEQLKISGVIEMGMIYLLGGEKLSIRYCEKFILLKGLSFGENCR